jgi:dihydroorotase
MAAMPSRREVLTAAAAACLPGVVQPHAQSTPPFDLVIAGGRVVDPASRHDAVADVAIRAGRIVRVAAGVSARDASAVIDARGKIVIPGLVDLHAHVDAEMPPAHCLSTGVTTLVDGGTYGAANVETGLALAGAAPNRVRLLLNLGRSGLNGLGAVGELLDIANADVGAARATVDAHRDRIVGIKIRLSKNAAGANDLEAVRRARQITAPLGLTVMAHIGQSVSPLPAILDLMGPGDIITHVYAPAPNGILDANGRVLAEVRAARARGVLFDIGNGRTAHITWDIAERALAQDFPPDTISSDLTAPGRTDRVFDFPTVLSKFLLLGMPLQQVVACGTSRAAAAIPAFKGLGTLAPGAEADVAVFELREGDFEFVDNERTVRRGRQKLVPVAVICGGRQL